MLAPILSIAQFNRKRPRGVIVATSGGFDPIHPGHIGCLMAARKLGDKLVVIVNGDGFLGMKKGNSFMPLDVRCQIVAAIKGVDYVIPYEVAGDMTVTGALEQLRPHIFANGGDRTASTIPEWNICKRLEIKLRTRVGPRKVWSSTAYLDKWLEGA